MTALGLAPGQGSALLLALLLPALAVPLARWLPRAHIRPARWLAAGLARSVMAERLAALLLLAAGGVHLGLIGVHRGAGLAGWMLLDGLAFVAAAAAVLLVRWWRWPAVALLLATLLTYLSVTGSGREQPDQLGMATALVELTALGLALAPLRPGRGWRAWGGASAGLLVAAFVTGGGVWAAAERHHRNTAPLTGGHVHGAPIPGANRFEDDTGTPAPEEQAAAARLAAETRTATARYQDPAVARAAGYRPGLGGDLVHWEHKGYKDDGRTLDPERPEQLVYLNTAAGPVLAGVVYVAPRAGVAAPRTGGPITKWHTHSLCLTPLPPFISALVTPFGNCPPLSVGLVLPEMMHVWTVDTPRGPFVEELDAATIARIRAEHHNAANGTRE